MPGHPPLRIGAAQGIHEVRRIGDDQIELLLGGICAEIHTYDLHPVSPGRTCHILLGLSGRCRINLDGSDLRFGAALGQLYSYQAATGAHVQYPAGIPDGSPGSQQDPVCAHLHGATVVVDGKLFELKVRVGHLGMYFPGGKIKQSHAQICKKCPCFCVFNESEAYRYQ